MCKNINISLSTLVVSWACCAFLYNKSPEFKYVSIFIATFATIQLLDALLWWAINTKQYSLNIFVSKFIVIIILLSEIIVAYYGAKYILGWNNFYFEVIIWIFVIAILFDWIVNCNKETIVYGEDKYLLWCDKPLNNSNNNIGKTIFLILVLTPAIFALKDIYLLMTVVGISVITFLLNFSYANFGARWCWSANIMSITTVVYYLITNHLKNI